MKGEECHLRYTSRFQKWKGADGNNSYSHIQDSSIPYVFLESRYLSACFKVWFHFFLKKKNYDADT